MDMNHETHAIKLWMDNDEGSFDLWHGRAAAVLKGTSDGVPNQFMDHGGNARRVLADALQEWHEASAEESGLYELGGWKQEMFTMALGSVDWLALASSLLDDVAEGYDGS